VVSAELVDDGGPRSIELLRGSRRPSSGDTVRLLDEGDGEALGERSVACRQEIARRDASARSVAEDEGGPRLA